MKYLIAAQIVIAVALFIVVYKKSPTFRASTKRIAVRPLGWVGRKIDQLIDWMSS